MKFNAVPSIAFSGGFRRFFECSARVVRREILSCRVDNIYGFYGMTNFIRANN